MSEYDDEAIIERAARVYPRTEHEECSVRGRRRVGVGVSMKPLRFHWHNLARHGIEAEDIEECLLNRHLLFRNPRGGNNEYKVIGRTHAGQYVEFVYEDKKDHWFVFHAMPARPADVRLYRRKVK